MVKQLWHALDHFYENNTILLFPWLIMGESVIPSIHATWVQFPVLVGKKGSWSPLPDKINIDINQGSLILPLHPTDK